MSNTTNSNLIEQANELMEYFTGTYVERVIQRDVESGDLEALRFHIAEYEAQINFERDESDVY
jgi:hypothetical protein